MVEQRGGSRRGGGSRGGSRGGGSRGGGPRGPRGGAEQTQALVDLVGIVARALVDNPEDVQVRKARGDRNPRIELSVAPDDIGKVIGKDGRTAQSLRVLLNAAANKLGSGRAHLDIID